MKPFDTLAPGAGSSVAIRAPKTLQAFEMLPQGMAPGAGVSSAAMGGKSYEIPPSMRSAAGAPEFVPVVGCPIGFAENHSAPTIQINSLNFSATRCV